MILEDLLKKFDFHCFNLIDNLFSCVDLSDLQGSQLFFESLAFKDRFFFPLNSHGSVDQKLLNILDDLNYLFFSSRFDYKVYVFDIVTIGFYVLAYSISCFFLEDDYSIFSVDVFFTYFLEFYDDHFKNFNTILTYNRFYVVSSVYFVFVKYGVLVESLYFHHDFSLQFVRNIKYLHLEKFSYLYHVYWSIASIDFLDHIYCFYL